MMPSPTTVVRDVHHRYGNRVALDGVDLELAPGQLCALEGHNGSGKSTLLRIIAGLLTPTGGAVEIVGQQAGSLEARAAVAYVGDTPILYDDLSIREHFEFTLRFHGIKNWEPQAERVAEELAIDGRLDDLPSALSRGLRQRAALALAFARPFQLLLIDEPFVGLDPDSRTRLVTSVNNARAAGATAIIATHHIDELPHVDRVLQLTDGRTSYDGPPAATPSVDGTTN